jgi:HPr kinase/phosphorylase
MISFSIEDLLARHSSSLGLKVLAGQSGLGRMISNPQAQMSGLSLTGFMDNYVSNRLLILGASEISYLEELPGPMRKERLTPMLRNDTPTVIIARSLPAPAELMALCDEKHIPLLQTTLPAMVLLGRLSFVLTEEFAPSISFQGTFVEVFGVGILLYGDDGIGKSEAALGLIDRGHRLVADESIVIRLKHRTFLEGTGIGNTRHMLEIRGIGMIDVTLLYGAVCVRDTKSVDMMIKLENWDNSKIYDRLGITEQSTHILGLDIPSYLLPVKPGRDVVLLIETLARNHRLKKMGIHSAKEFGHRLTEAIQKKQKQLAEEGPMEEYKEENLLFPHD